MTCIRMPSTESRYLATAPVTYDFLSSNFPS